MKAIVIQNIVEYLNIITKYTDELMEEYATTGATFEGFVTWLIAEELELIYGIFIDGHPHNKMPYCAIHSQLNAILPIPLSVLTAWYVKAPAVYEYATITIEIKDTDLLIIYRAEKPYQHNPQRLISYDQSTNQVGMGIRPNRSRPYSGRTPR